MLSRKKLELKYEEAKTMKKNLIYGILVILLVGVALYFFRSNNKSTIRKKDSNFAIEDTSRVSAIRLTKTGEEVYLERTTGKWMIDGEIMARPSAVNAFLNVMMRLEVRTPVSKSMQKKIVEYLNTRGSELTIYSGSKILKNIKIYEDTVNNATYMMLEGARQPFVIQLPGYSSSIGKLFIADKSYWRDNIIFASNVSEILIASVDYPLEPAISYKIENTGNGFLLKSLYDGDIIKNADMKKILNYLYEFNHIIFDEFLLENITETEKEEYIKADPRIIITLKDINNRTITLKGFPIAVEGKFDELGNSIKYDLDRMYGIINDKDLVIVSYFEISGVLKKLNDFFQE